MGGNFHLKLNIDSRPIANKYREGKVKRTLERELKVPEIAEEGSEWNQFLGKIAAAKVNASASARACDLTGCAWCFLL